LTELGEITQLKEEGRSARPFYDQKGRARILKTNPLPARREVSTRTTNNLLLLPTTATMEHTDNYISGQHTDKDISGPARHVDTPRDKDKWFTPPDFLAKLDAEFQFSSFDPCPRDWKRVTPMASRSPGDPQGRSSSSTRHTAKLVPGWPRQRKKHASAIQLSC